MVEELKLGLILLNDFHNESIVINNKTFRNLEAPLILNSSLLKQQSPLEKQYIEMLSLEKLNQFHINNTNKIEYLEIEATISKFLIATILLIFLLTLTLYKFICKTKRKIPFCNNSNKNNLEVGSSIQVDQKPDCISEIAPN